MAEDNRWSFATALISSIQTLLMVFGVVVVLLGLGGGIRYQNWFVLSDEWARVLTLVFGFSLFGLGLWKSSQSANRIGNLARYGIKITAPADGDDVCKVDVRGEIKKALPEGYSLRIFRIYPSTNNLVPVGVAQIDLAKKTWIAHGCHIGGKPGWRRALTANIVGKNGAALIEFHDAACEVHDKTMKALAALGREPEWLPQIETRTDDMYEVGRVNVRRNNAPG